MSISSLDGVSSYSDVTDALETQGGGELDREAFLNLLVTQLQYQDPLNPQDNSEFVAQLAQFSSLEQLTNANSALESLYAAMASMNNATMTQLLGKQVSAYSEDFSYDGDGDVELYYDAASDASTASITITDEDGTVVYEGDIGALSEGDGSWTWDGTDQDGNTVDEGTYSFSISAEDTDGDEVTVDSIIKGEVDGMSFSGGTPVPSIDGVEFSLGDIIEVQAASSDSEEEDASSSTSSDDTSSSDSSAVTDDSGEAS